MKESHKPGPRIPEREPIELMPDAWERFERAVGTVVKSGPKHRPARKPKPMAVGKPVDGPKDKG